MLCYRERTCAMGSGGVGHFGGFVVLMVIGAVAGDPDEDAEIGRLSAICQHGEFSADLLG